MDVSPINCLLIFSSPTSVLGLLFTLQNEVKALKRLKIARRIAGVTANEMHDKSSNDNYSNN